MVGSNKYDIPDSQPPEGDELWEISPLKGKPRNGDEKVYTEEEWAAWEKHESSSGAFHGQEPKHEIGQSSSAFQCAADEWIWEVEAFEEPSGPYAPQPFEHAWSDEEAEEEHDLEQDPVSEITETATPGSPWEYEEPRPKLHHVGDKPRKPRASNRANQRAAAASKETKALDADQARGSDSTNTVKWGPVTKVGKATMMSAFGQQVDFHTLNLKELIDYAKKVDTTSWDLPPYVESTLGYIWELWSTWNTDSEGGSCTLAHGRRVCLKSLHVTPAHFFANIELNYMTQS